jgi:glycosyltransferase involved in cell wall biosynthesis
MTATAVSPATFSPVYVGEVELSEPIVGIVVEPAYRSARLLARWHSEPLAVVDVPLAAGAATAGEVSDAVWAAAQPLVTARRGTPTFADGRTAALRTAPTASVIICTRDRAERLAKCLDAVLAQQYPHFEVIVVDNAPVNDAVADLVERRRDAGTGGVPLRRLVEPRPGLSWARNMGLYAATGRIVAYLDDDEHPDRYWLAELARGFEAAPRVAGVSGLVLPAVLDTPAQRMYEEFGGYSKGRGFAAEVFDTASHARQHPLYPLPPFGVGASMAFDRAALLRIGGFDVALGAGTLTRGGEDTAAITDLMLAGGTFVYWPGSVMWHEHRRAVAEVAHQLNGYGSGLTAFYLRALLRRPLATVGALARLAPRAVRDLRGKDSVRTATMTDQYPASLRRASVRGMLAGPVRYLRSCRAAARIKAGWL